VTKAASSVLAGIAVILLGGCGESARDDAAAAAIHAVLISKAGDAGGYGSLFPTTARTVPCLIHGGGPYPGVRIPGTCATVIAFGPKDSAVVRFVESWDSTHFRGMRDPQGRLTHTWEFTVSSRGDVRYVRQYGAVAPQEIP
jgi:hypothetical protein